MIAAMLALTTMVRTSFNIRDYGAIDDGQTVCTSSIQAAIDKAANAGGGMIEVPAGLFVTGTIHLKSRVELHLDKGAVLQGSPHRSDYRRGIWYALIIASDTTGTSITGKGTIDGQGVLVAQDVLRMVREGTLKIPSKSWRPSETDRPEIVEFTRCSDVTVRGVTIKNGSGWVQTYRNCRGLEIQGIKVDSKTYWNNDGIDVVDCQNTLIADSDFDADDDGICLKSVGPKDMCENITIEKCRVRSSASAIKFGTTSGGGFRHVRIRHIDIWNTFRSAVALESVDGGLLEDVEVDGIRAKHTGNAFFIRLGHRDLKRPPGRVRNIVLKNFDVEVPSGRPDFGEPFKGPQFSEPHNICPSSIVGHIGDPIENVLLENISVRMPGGGDPSIAFVPRTNVCKVPERPTEYPEFTNFGELPAWALYVRHARGITLRNVRLVANRADYRPAFVFDDVVGVRGSGVSVGGADKSPTAVLHDSNRIRLGGQIHFQIDEM